MILMFVGHVMVCVSCNAVGISWQCTAVLQSRHPRCVCNINVQCKEVKTQQIDL